MATYKLIQDIEAEDHILGPLSLRQFIFALIGVFCWYLSFIIFVKHVYFLLAITLPPAVFCTFFAIPFGRDQPTEIWALAKLRFWFKPRRRIWDQSGVKELVTITVPKKVERVLTKGFSQSEVQSRLKALANTLDSRGWAIKNVNLDTYTSPTAMQGESDRLININNVPQQVPSYDVQASDDILDETSNPVAQQFQSMITQSSQEHRKHLIDELNEIRAGQGQVSPQQTGQTNGWFMNRSAAGNTNVSSPPPASGSQLPAPAIAASTSGSAGQPAVSGSKTANDITLPAPSNSRSLSYSHMRTLRPIGSQPQPTTGTQPATSSYTSAPASAVPSGASTPDPAILSLANNNDLNVSTLAREAHKAKRDEEPPQDEVVISLR